MKQATGIALGADLPGAVEVQYVLVKEGNGAATEGALAIARPRAAVSASASCAR
jgi:hypothetical protein